MSQLEVDKIIPQSGTTLTIGDSGDTITFADGAVIGIDTDTLYIDSANNRVGIGTSSPTESLFVQGSGTTRGEFKSTGSGSASSVGAINDTGTLGRILMFGSTQGAYGSLGSGEMALYSNTAGMSIMNDNASGVIKFSMQSGAEKMRIDSSGNVGIGTSSPSNPLHLSSTSYPQFAIQNSTSTYRMGVDSNQKLIFDPISGSTRNIVFQNSGAGEINVGIGTSSPKRSLQIGDNTDSLEILSIQSTTSGTSRIYFGSNDGTNAEYSGYLWYDHSNDSLRIGTDSTERMRIDSSGEVLIGTTTSALTLLTGSTETGSAFGQDGISAFTRSGNTIANFNRISNDGVLISLRQDGTAEGSISVSGTTVSYNGGHLSRWSQLLDITRDESILKGTVMSNLDEMCSWVDADGNAEDNEQLNKMKVSDTEGDDNVAGVFVNWDNDDDVYTNDMNIAMTGDMVIRIAQGVPVHKGQLLMSAGDGTAKPQGDDIVRSKTIAKVTSNNVTKTYDDGSYLVPCVLMAC